MRHLICRHPWRFWSLRRPCLHRRARRHAARLAAPPTGGRGRLPPFPPLRALPSLRPLLRPLRASRYSTTGASGVVPAGTPGGSDTARGDEQSFVRDGRRYYWHYRNGHRFYSSRPEPGDATVCRLGGVGADLDAPLSREERAQRAARMQKAQAHLAAVEKRVARQRHLLRLREQAAKPKPRRSAPRQ